MPIQDGDINLITSQVMNDVDEGGGRPTGVAIADGLSNSIFPDISELDRAYGRVNLRKVFVKVNTPTTDSYYGANVIISDAPDDPKVSCTLFTTNDGFDRRTDAKSRLESYVIAGPLDAMIPYGQQVAGQKAVLAYQRVESSLPSVGQVFAITSGVDNINQQYFRITEITDSIQVFEDERGIFERRVIMMIISEPLRYTFYGEEPQRIPAQVLGPLVARIRKTTVADAARYYGVLPITQAASLGALNLKLSSVYTPLVPSSTAETALASSALQNAVTIKKSGGTATVSSAQWLGGAPMFVRGGILPLSLVMTAAGGAGTFNPKTDDGAGNIVNAAGTVLGSVDYINGAITPNLTVVGAWDNAHAITYTYGGVQQQPTFTSSTEVSLATRGTVYIKTAQPLPSPKTAVVEYMTLGKWYVLRDLKGDGILVGDETAFGAGSVNYVTGAIVVTLGALPDVGSDVIFSWGSNVDSFERNTATMLSKFTVAKGNIDRSSLTVSLSYGGSVVALTESGTGVLSGGGLTGTVNYTTGDIVLNGYRDYNTDVTIAYSRGYVAGSPDAPLSTTLEITDYSRPPDNSAVLLTSPSADIVPNTVNISFNVRVVSVPSEYYTMGGDKVFGAIDDGAGNLILKSTLDSVGTIDYSSGVITLHPRRLYPISVAKTADREAEDPNWRNGSKGFLGTETVNLLADLSTFGPKVTVSFQTADVMAVVTPESETYNPPLIVKFANNEKMVPNSLVFTLGTNVYTSRAASLYKNISFANGSGIESGSLDTLACEAYLTFWDSPSGATIPALSVQSCLTFVDGRFVTTVSFRTAGAPIRAASLYVQATSMEGTLLTATANTDGVISGDGVSGFIRNNTGSASVSFGEMVSAAGKENEWWYLADQVVGGMIYMPIPVNAQTITYNAVVTTTLPLDSNVLGIDPVRLPNDGRVPIIRAGDVCVVHNTQTTISKTVVNAEVLDVGRTRLSRVRVFDDNDAPINAGFTTDLDAGTVTFNDVTGYAQPIRVEHRIEDMSLISDAQINGDIRLSRQLTHDFPLGSFVSSALIVGDMQARVPVLFDQSTWVANAWSDTIHTGGSPATATYNDALSPVIVTNEGAITERWVVRFTNTTSFEVIGEHVGTIATGDTSNPCAPINPTEGTPYFTIPAAGWGSGWAVGNILRFNTIGALFPVWVSRTIQQGASSLQNDAFTILIRGDIDRP